jgi:hypothetical protein
MPLPYMYMPAKKWTVRLRRRERPQSPKFGARMHVVVHIGVGLTHIRGGIEYLPSIPYLYPQFCCGAFRAGQDRGMQDLAR